jgi:hypothetical protein
VTFNHQLLKAYSYDAHNYRATKIIETSTWYETNNPTNYAPGKNITVNGESMGLVGSITMTFDFGTRSLMTHTINYPQNMQYEDYCGVFLGPAENTNHATVAHYNADGSLHETFTWTDGQSAPRCSSYIPVVNGGGINSWAYQIALSRLGLDTLDAVSPVTGRSANGVINATFQKWGIDRSHPLQLAYAVHHKRLQIGTVHVEDYGSDLSKAYWSDIAAGVVMAGFAAAGVGLASPVLIPTVVLAYASTVAAALVVDAIRDNGPPPPPGPCSDNCPVNPWDPNLDPDGLDGFAPEMQPIALDDQAVGDRSGDGVGDGSGPDDGSPENDGSGDWGDDNGCGNYCGSDSNPPPKSANALAKSGLVQ